MESFRGFLLAALYVCMVLAGKDPDLLKTGGRAPEWTNLMDARIKFKSVYTSASVDLKCPNSGEPKPETRWLKNGKNFTERSTGEVKQTRRGKLRLINVVMGDSGNYTCIVKNEHGSINHTYQLRVKAHPNSSPPYIVEHPPNVTEAALGDTVTLKCPVISSGAVFLQWVKHYQVNGSWTHPTLNYSYVESVQLSSDQSIKSPEEYTIYNLTANDTGKYTCMASNDYGRFTRIKWVVLVNETSANQESVYKGETDLPRVAPVIVETSNHNGVYIAVGVSVIVLICVVIGAICYARRRRQPIKRPFMLPEREEENPLYVLQSDGEISIPLDDRWEISRELLQIGDLIGEGAFGQVHKGFLIMNGSCPKIVAVKMLKPDATEKEFSDLLMEMATMKNIENHHKNIVNFIGCCTQGKGPLYVITEFAPFGNLRDFLKKHRNIHLGLKGHLIDPSADLDASFAKPLKLKDLMSYSFQIAKGMEYLASKKIIHRDLAARNVLVGENYEMKIADYGFARNLAETDYYRKTTGGRLPVKWMAPEALFDRVYTQKSDVWSYGVLLWEIYTYGGNPYPAVPLESLYELLEKGHRMAKPNEASYEMYRVMLDCWKLNPVDRPDFSDLVSIIGQLLEDTADDKYLSLDPDSEVESIPSSEEDDVFIRRTPLKDRGSSRPRRSDSQYNSMSSSQGSPSLTGSGSRLSHRDSTEVESAPEFSMSMEFYQPNHYGSGNSHLNDSYKCPMSGDEPCDCELCCGRSRLDNTELLPLVPGEKRLTNSQIDNYVEPVNHSLVVEVSPYNSFTQVCELKNGPERTPPIVREQTSPKHVTYSNQGDSLSQEGSPKKVTYSNHGDENVECVIYNCH